MRDLNLDKKYKQLKNNLVFLDEFQKDWNYFCNLSATISFDRERRDIDNASKAEDKTHFTLLQVAILKNYGRLMKVYFDTKILPNFNFISVTESDLLKAGSEIYRFTTEASIYHPTINKDPHEVRRIQLAGLTFISALRGLVESQNIFKKITIWSLYLSPILFALAQLVEVIRKIFICK